MIATGALLAWPIVTLILMVTMRARTAMIWSLLGGYLLLPVDTAFDLKGVPTLDKSSIPSLAAFLLALMLAGRGGFKWPRSTTVNLLMACFVASPFLTSMTNTDPIVLGTVYLPPMDLYSAFSMSAANAITLLPFILGAGMLRDEASHRSLLLIFVMAALVYTLPVLAEIRLSPFLQGKIYKVGSVDYFLQQMRGGGFRSMVFLGHGLLVSTFLGMAVVGAVGLWRARQRVWFASAALCAFYLFAVLLLNKSVGSIVLSVLIAVVFMMLKPRRFIGVAVVIAAMVMIYPILRASQLVPYEKMLAAAETVSTDRAGSFEFRLRNEEMLLNRANDRPLFGWGAFGRNRVFSVTDSGGARDLSVTDGTWIIAIGSFGWFGYLSMFGLLCYPCWHMFRLRKRIATPIHAALVAMLIFNLLDLMPNSSLRPITWLLGGALSGLAIVRQPAGTARVAGKTPAAEPQPATA